MMKRTKGLKRTGTLKRSRLKPRSEKRRQVVAETGEPAYVDSKGIAFADYTLWLPPRVSDWPSGPPRVVCDSEGVQAAFHRDFAGKPCWWCGELPSGMDRMELHHLAAGSRGRSHERALFCWTCSRCHAEHAGEDDLGRWLFLKFCHDAEHMDWVLTAIRLRRFLPDLIENAF